MEITSTSMQNSGPSDRLTIKNHINYSAMDSINQNEKSLNLNAASNIESSNENNNSQKQLNINTTPQTSQANPILSLDVEKAVPPSPRGVVSSPLHEPILVNSEIEIGTLYKYLPNKLLPRLLLYPSPNLNHRYSDTIAKKTIFLLLQNHGKFKLISCLGHEGWIYVPDQSLLNKEIFQPLDTFHAYEDWPGENFFYADGQIMLGHDRYLCIGTCLFIFILTILFFACVIHKLLFYEIYLALSILLLGYMYYNLYLTATSDPGIIPRNPQHTVPILPTGASTVGPLGWRFCTTCNLYRPPRSKHCKTCQNCVEEFDHHCPYTSNCIGLRNARYFLRFVIAITIYSVSMMIMCWLVIIENANDNDDNVVSHRYAQSILDNPVALMIGIITCLSSLVLVPFCFYHIQIRSKAITTNEQVRGIFLSPENQYNPYDRGCCQNYATLCCDSLPPSRIPNLTRSYTAAEYVKAHIDPKKHPDIYGLYFHEDYANP